MFSTRLPLFNAPDEDFFHLGETRTLNWGISTAFLDIFSAAHMFLYHLNAITCKKIPEKSSILSPKPKWKIRIYGRESYGNLLSSSIAPPGQPWKIKRIFNTINPKYY